MFLCPENSDVLKIVKTEKNVEITTEDSSFFSFPLQDVKFLPLKHTTVEELSKYFWCIIVDEIGYDVLKTRGIEVLEIVVEETPGQEGIYRKGFTG